MYQQPAGKIGIATVHGAVCDHRVNILLDSGSSTSMISLDLARKLGLKLSFNERLKVTGIGGVVTHVTAKAAVKVTLGLGIIYYLDLWAGNIGEGIDCLLGFDFMVRAGVRLCANDGSVRLPDEERVPLVASGFRPKLPERVSVNTQRELYVPLGRSCTVPIIYGRHRALELEVWASRHDSWVTTIVHDPDGRPECVRITNVSSKPLVIPPRTAVAHLVEEGHLPLDDRCARVHSSRYREWQTLAYESSISKVAAQRLDQADDAFNASLPPAVPKRAYDAPTKILSRGEVAVVPELAGGASKAPSHATGPSSPVPASPAARLPDTSVSLPRTSAPSAPAVPAKLSLPAELTAEAGSAGAGVVMTALEETSVAGTNSLHVQPFQVASAGATSSAKPDASLHVTGPRATSTTDNPAPARPAGASGIVEYKLRMGLKLVRDRKTPPSALVERLSHMFKLLASEDDDISDEAVSYYHEGTDFVLLEELRSQLAVLPDQVDLPTPVDMSAADVGEKGVTSPAEDQKIRDVINKHATGFLSSGNALPPPARGVVCDIEVEPGTRPIAEKPRRIKSHLLPQVYELLKKLLEAMLIEYSDSEWASPIVIVMKKNGVDIRLCIDYRRVNQLIKLLNYPLPLIDELLSNFEAAMWFLSLDMASGFWAVLMTERAKQISAFVCPLGHFQWIRMPFGLKNAPLIYPKMIDNALWGYVRLPPHLEAEVEPEVMKALGLEVVSEPAATQSELENANKTVFELNIPAPRCMGPVLQRSSYIDDIAYGAPTLDELLDVLDKLLYRLRYWRISVSLPKSAFGKKSIRYLSHEVNEAGIIATPKIVKALRDMPFPTSLRGVQSFLGSLNYYNKFIEDYSVIASSLYELTDERIRASDSLDQAKRAFELLKSKILAPPLLKHPDRTKPYVVIPHANQWAVGAVLGQEHDGVIVPVRFTGRTLHDAELSYHPAEKEILALLRVLNVYYTLVAGQDLVVYTRFSSLKWILTSKSVQGRLLQWSALLSPWTMEVRRVDRDEDGLSAILAASITPREKLDEVAAGLAPMKAMRVKPNLVSLEMLDAEYVGYVLSFDGAAKLKTSASSASFVLWELPGWHPVFAKSLYIEGITVNEAEYSGLLQGLAFTKAWRPEDPIRKLVIVGDSRIVVQQCQGLIRCNQPHLALLLARYHELQTGFESIDLVHVKREFNGAADYLAGLALRSGQTQSIEDPEVFDQLRRRRRQLLEVDELGER
jgi:ribonuclease HI